MRVRQRVCNGSFVPFTIIHTCSKEFYRRTEVQPFAEKKKAMSHATDDLDPSKLNQHVTRLLDLRGPDHCESIPGRPHCLSQLQIIALTMQIYQFTNGQETHLIEARSILTARQKLERQGVDPGSFALVKIAWGDEIPTD